MDVGNASYGGRKRNGCYRYLQKTKEIKMRKIPAGHRLLPGFYMINEVNVLWILVVEYATMKTVKFLKTRSK